MTVPRCFRYRFEQGGHRRIAGRGTVEQASLSRVGLQEPGDLLAEPLVAAAGLVEVRRPLVRCAMLDGAEEDLPELFKLHAHGR